MSVAGNFKKKNVMYTFANRVMLIRRYVLHQDESLNAKILKKTCFYFIFFLANVFGFFWKWKYHKQAIHLHWQKWRCYSFVFFTLSLGPKNLFFLFFLSHAHTMTNLKSVAHSICQTWYRILKIVVLNTWVPCSGRGLFTPNTLNGDLC